MADSIIQIPPDSTGKKLDTEQLTVGANTVERERIQIAGAGATDIAPVDGTAGLKVDLGADNDVEVPFDAAEGAALPSTFVVVAGDDGVNTHPLQVDGSGRLKVLVDSQTGNVTIDGTVTANLSATDNAVLDAIQTAVEIIDNAVAGSEMQVDVITLPATPTGTNKVGIVGKDIINPHDGATALTIAFDEIDAASSGDNAIVAAQGAGNRIIVLSVVLVCSGGANTVEWRSATTPISGGMGFADLGGYSVASEFGLFETADNEALNLNLGSATSVDGHISYVVA